MLGKIQTIFANDLFNPEVRGDYDAAGDFSAAELIGIYRNNYFQSLSAALRATYGCVLRLVGADFFNALARDYLKKYPPTAPGVRDCGAHFADFIRHSKICAPLPYLADVADFERLYELCYHSRDGRFLFSSIYPIIKIWQLDEDSETLDLGSGGDHILICKAGDEVSVERIAPEIFKQLKKQQGEI